MNKNIPKQQPPKLTELPESSFKSFRKIAFETGKFYTDFIDVLLKSKNSTEQKEQSQELINSLPIPMKKLYQKGVETLLKEIERNKRIMDKHRGQEKDFLMREFVTNLVISPEGHLPEWFEETYNEHVPNTSNIKEYEYSEPAPGIPILYLKKSIYNSWQGDLRLGQARYVPATNSVSPSFIVAKNDVPYSGIKHEVSHLVFNFLSKNNYFRSSQENESDDKNMEKAFDNFRNEIIAYILQKSFYDGNFVNKYIVTRDSMFLVYDEDAKINKMGTKAKEQLFSCMVFGKSKNIEPESFIYVCLASKNFQEFNRNCVKLIYSNENATTLPTSKEDWLKLVDNFFDKKLCHFNI